MTEVEAKKMTRKQRRNAPARKHPLDTPELRAEMLRLMREGCTLTEICARPDMPAIATYFDWKTKDPEFKAQIDQAMVDHAETIISDAMDQSIAGIDAMIDPAANGDGSLVKPSVKADHARARVSDLYLQAALRYAGAIAPHKYGSLVKLADAQLGNGVSISITSYATHGSADAAHDTQDVDSTS